VSEQGLWPSLDIVAGSGSKGGYLWCVLKCLKGVVKNHRQEKEEFDGQDRIVTRSELKFTVHGAEDEVEKSGDEQKGDGDPGESLKRSAPLVQNLDSCPRRQGMDRRAKDKEEEGDPAYPQSKRDHVKPKVQAVEKDKKTHFFLKAALCLPFSRGFCNLAAVYKGCHFWLGERRS